MDLGKLTPAPWASRPGNPGDCVISKAAGNVTVAAEIDEDTSDAAFIALARNAFDVMMRRGWNAARDIHRTWFVQNTNCNAIHRVEDNDYLAGSRIARFPDPFTALIEADKWYAANRGDHP